MKRITALLMIWSLLCGLLVGCGTASGTTQGETEMSQTEQQGAQTEATTTQAEPTQTEPEPTQTESASEVVYHYTMKYTRLSDEPINELQPSKDYGCILPFQGEAMDHFVCGEPYVNTGFIDASGRIIVDPVYQSVRALTGENYYGWEGCVWLLGQGEVADMDMSGYHFYLSNARYGLASCDGSIVIDLMYDDIYEGGNHIFAKKYLNDGYDKYDLDIYNYDCEMVASFSDLEHEAEAFSEDILVVCKGEKYYYMDLSGKILSGPYLEAESFSCGYGLVKIETEQGERYTYVDKSGKLLSEDGWMTYHEDYEPYQVMGFHRAQSFVNGAATVELNNGWEKYSVLTTNNELLFDFRYFDGYQCTEEYILDAGRGSTDLYAPDGTLLYSYPELALQRMSDIDDSLLYDPWGNRIYNWKTGEVFDGFEGMIWEDNTYYEDFPYYEFVNEETEECILTDGNRNVLFDKLGRFSNKNRDAFNGKYYITEYTENGRRLIIPHLGVDTKEFGNMIEVYNDLIMTVDGGACCYYNSDLELVFCYPFT